MEKKIHISPYLSVLLSFFIIIMVGSFLLVCPFCQASGNWGSYIDTLLVATSATCVTGLCSLENGIGGDLNFAGQLIVLIMIQIGGLGFITLLGFIMSFLKRKIDYKERYFFSQAVNADSIAHVSSFIRKVILVSLIIEVIGFLLGLPVYLTMPNMRVDEAIWASIFTSISSFNNAGFDIFGATSLIRGAGNTFVDSMPTWAYYYLCSYIMLLIILGGLSFPVIIEIFSFKKKPKQYRSFTKVVLLMTLCLLVFGFLLLWLTEGINNPNFGPFEALFQSVTCRTAGYVITPQGELSTAGKAISCLLMFIGGSPLSTAGGIKTVTFFVIVLGICKYLAGKKVTAFNRKYSQTTILKAMAVTFIAIFVVVIGFVLISLFEKSNTRIDGQTRGEFIIYEVFSAFGTVGVTAGITPYLTIGSKLILCLIMFIGRLGPITLFQVFTNALTKKHDDHFDYVEEEISIG